MADNSNAVALDVVYRRPDGTPTDPNPSQARAHASNAFELLFGGEVFGGKTDFLIMEAILTALEVPAASIAFAALTLKDLTGTVLQRFFELIPRLPNGDPILEWNAGKNRFTNVLNQAVIQFIYCDHPNDVRHYFHDQWLLLCIDQLEGWGEARYLFLLQRVRSRFLGHKPRVRATANPHGGWLKRRFVVPADVDLGGRALPARGERWVPQTTITPESPNGLTRQFIPASASENVEGTRADPTYFARLASTQSAREMRRLKGDWDAWEGQLFEAWAAQHFVTPEEASWWGLQAGRLIDWHVIAFPTWVPLDDAVLYISVDYGYGQPWAAYVTAFLDDDHCVTFKEWYGTHVKDVEQVEKIARWVEETRAYRLGAGRPMWTIRECMLDAPSGSRQEYGRAESIYEVYDTRLGKLGIAVRPMPRHPGTRKAGLQRVLGALECAEDGFPHWQVTVNCPNLIRTLPELPKDPLDPDDVDTDAEDHAYDAMKGLFLARPAGPKGVGSAPREEMWPGQRPTQTQHRALNIQQFRLAR